MTDRYRWNKNWRLRYPKKRTASTRRYYARHRETTANQQNTGQRWTLTELELITAPDRQPDTVLAKRLGRSLQSLQVKRSRLRAKS